MPSKNLCHNLSVCSGFVNFATSKSGGSCRRRQGEMVEWSITPVLKTGIRRRIGGSNPSLSAKISVTSCITTSCADFSFKGAPNLRQNFGSNNIGLLKTQQYYLIRF